MSNQHVIELDRVSFAYPAKAIGTGPVQAIDQVSMTIDQGARLGILGPNGGGKSTLIKLILGLLQPTSGSIKVLNKTPKQARLDGLVGYLPQHNQSNRDWPLNVQQVVTMGRISKLSPWKKPSSTDRDMVHNALELVGMGDFASRSISALSGGQLQRVMIARAIANHPKLLILDEPTVGVDVVGQQQFSQLIETLQSKLDLTLVVVSHDMRAIAAVADQIACLSKSLHFHNSPDGLTPSVLAQVFAHDVEGVFGNIHIDAHRAQDCEDDDCIDTEPNPCSCTDHQSGTQSMNQSINKENEQ